MKTTIDLPDDLLIAAKMKAVESRTTLRELVTRGLRKELEGQGERPRSRGIRWIVVDGGLPEELDVSDRALMSDWIRRSK